MTPDPLKKIWTWHEIPEEDRIDFLRGALDDILHPSTDPESGSVQDKPRWWDDFWSGFFIGARYKKSLMELAQSKGGE